MSDCHGDFAFEPIPGLPALPPAGEKILWQGRPSRNAMAVQFFHVR
ncbi:MAG: PH domain-containing protein, partial [Pseudomonadota bacterium]